MELHIKEAIDRIQHMESLFDYLQQTVADNQTAIHTDAAFQESLSTLVHYYESDLWLADYALDEQGLLPTTLKRGVLSQDGLYDFLTQLQEH